MEGSLVRLLGRRRGPGYVLLPFDCIQPRRRRNKRTSPMPVVIPTELLFAAFRQLFPAERMLIMGGRARHNSVIATNLVDVTEPMPSIVHVRADRRKLGTGLLDLSRSGAHLAVWVHSHPGLGARATHPSGIDLAQEEELRRHYSEHLICLIVVHDGHVRAWGRAVDAGSAVLRWQGRGVVACRGERNVYRLALD